MTRVPFLEAIDQRVLVCDGAMGTMLYGKGIFLNRWFDELNLTQPDLVAEVHQAYVRAGADVIETNTFGANRMKLGAFGLAERTHAINLQGARIARHAARDQLYVAGAIGPLGVRIEPWGKTGVDEAEQYFREQAKALVEGGVDLFVLETFRDVNEVSAAISAVRSICDLPIVAQVTTEEDGNTLDGAAPESFVPGLEYLGATIVGVNCSVGPAAMLETIERMAQVATVKLSAQPNAGRPREIEGRNIYLCSPEYMASYARRFINNGVRLVGGCCGTTPEHIRHIKMAVRALAPADRPREKVSVPRPAAPHVERRAARPEVPDGGRPRARDLRGLSGARAAARLQRRRADRAGAGAARQRRGSREHPRRAARQRADERAVRVGHRPAADRHRDDPSLRLPRPEPARHAVGPPRRALDGDPQRAAGHRRSAIGRGLSRCDGGVRRRFDRADERRFAVESAGSTSAGSRSARRPRSTSASPRIPALRTSRKKSAASNTR